MIKINDDYAIIVSKECITLYETKIMDKGKQKGELVLRNARYYPNFEIALKHLVDLHVQDDSITDLKDIVKKINSLKKDITKAMTKL